MNKKNKLKHLVNELQGRILDIESTCDENREYGECFQMALDCISDIENIIQLDVERYICYNIIHGDIVLYTHPDGGVSCTSMRNITLDALANNISQRSEEEYRAFTFDNNTAKKLRDTGLFKIKKVDMF